MRHLLLVILLVSVIGFNFVTRNDTKNASDEIYKTILARLIPSEFGNIEDQTLIEDSATLLTTKNIKDKYLNEIYAVKDPQLINIVAKPADNYLAFTPDNSAVMKPDILGTSINGRISNPADAVTNRREIIYYTVGNGDTVSTIARSFGISVNTILWANNLTAFSLIRPDDKLMILPSSGVLYVVARGDTIGKIALAYGVTEDQINSYNNIGEHLLLGQKLIIPGAKKISSPTIAARPTSPTTGIGVIKNLIKSPKAQSSANKMNWPTAGYRISQYFSWRHPGVDIANKVGTPIYAADAGVVITSQGGYNGGYGNTIVIDHGGGKKTRYGHASKLFVKVGEHVEKGENIAAMGSTGRSTGPHLHFEVIINGAKYNPLNYIK